MRAYCPNPECSQPTEYISTRPKFCSHCGGSFEESAASLAQTPVQRAIAAIHKEPVVKQAPVLTRQKQSFVRKPRDIDGEVDATEVPELPMKLEVDIQINKPSRENMGSVVGTGGGNLPREKVKAGKIPNSKKVFAEFSKEAGSIRKGDSAEIG